MVRIGSNRAGPAKAALAMAIASMLATAGASLAQPSGAQTSARYETAREALATYYRRLAQVRTAVNEVDFDAAALARRIGNAIPALYSFVRDEIAFEPYPGALRMDRGTLMSRAGNACDQAILLVAMLRAHGYPARYARATLDDGQARRVLEGFNVPPSVASRSAVGIALGDDEVRALALRGLAAADVEKEAAAARAREEAFLRGLSLGFAFDYATISGELANAGIAPAAATDRAALLAATRQHCWAQVQSGGAWIDLDPSLRAFQVGDRLREPESVSDHLPAAIAHQLHVLVQVEQTKDGQTTLKPVLDKTIELIEAVNAIDLTIVPESESSSLTRDMSKPDFVAGIKIYRPRLAVNGALLSGYPFDLRGEVLDMDPTARGAAAVQRAVGGLFGAMTRALEPPQPAAPAGDLVRVLLKAEVRAPGGAVSASAERELARRPEGGEAERDRTDGSLRRQFAGNLQMIATGSRITKAYVVARRLDQELALRKLSFGLLGDMYRQPLPDADATRDAAPDRLSAEVLEFFQVRHALMQFSAATRFPGLVVFPAAPQVVGFREGVRLLDTGAEAWERRFDILFHRIAAVPAAAGSATEKAIAEFRVQQGIIDTLTEYLLLGGGESVNAHAVLAQAVRGNLALAVVRPEGRAALDALRVDRETRAALAADLARGYVIVAPVARVGIGGRQEFAWWRIDPATGETLGMDRHGGGMAEYALTLKNVMKVAAMPLLCVAFTAASPLIGDVVNEIAATLGDQPAPNVPHPSRSWQRLAAEYAVCLALSYGLHWGAAVGLPMLAGRAGARPPAMEAPPPPPRGAAGGPAGGSAGGARAFEPAAQPPARSGGGRSGGAFEPEALAVYERPAKIDMPGERPAGFDSAGDTAIVRPGANKPGDTFAGHQPGPRPPGEPGPEFGGRPLTPTEQFHAMINEVAPAPRPVDPAALGRWQGMSPAERQTAIEAYQKLQKANPFGDPQRLLENVAREGRNGLSPDELVMRSLTSVGDPPIGGRTGVRMDDLARATGLSPAEARAMLDKQAGANLGRGRVIEVGPDGEIRVVREDLGGRSVTPFQRQIIELAQDAPRQNSTAWRDAIDRADFDRGRGISPDQTLAGAAQNMQVPASQLSKRTGMSPDQVRQNLSGYLQRKHGMSPEEANRIADDYVRGDQGPPPTGPAWTGPGRPPPRPGQGPGPSAGPGPQPPAGGPAGPGNRPISPFEPSSSGELGGPWGRPPTGQEPPSWQQRPDSQTASFPETLRPPGAGAADTLPPPGDFSSRPTANFPATMRPPGEASAPGRTTQSFPETLRPPGPSAADTLPPPGDPATRPTANFPATLRPPGEGQPPGRATQSFPETLRPPAEQRPPAALPRPEQRASFLPERNTTLHEAIEQHAGGRQNLPSLHVTDRAALRQIVADGTLQAPARGGASWSRPGTGTLREGDVAIRVRPGREGYIEWRVDPNGTGLVPIHWPSGQPGVGRSTTYVPTEHLQWFNPGRSANEARWVDFPPRRQ